MSLKAILYRCGALSGYHRFANRRRLTVPMLHRVLHANDPRFIWSDPEYTLPSDRFRLILRFMKRHYNIVSLDDLLDGRRLPSRPLLLTFDDGWADNVDTALPILVEEKVSATMFVAAGHIGATQPFWQELVYGTWRAGALPPHFLDSILPAAGSKGEERIREAITLLAALPSDARRPLLDPLVENSAWPGRSMCTSEELRDWVRAGMSVGTHGMSHDPLDQVPEVAAEVVNARRALATASGQPESRIVSMSFPHGRYTPVVAGDVVHSGYKLLFTSDRYLNAADSERAVSPQLGRIYITDRFVTDQQGSMRPENLATWLFTQPAKA